jgi:hypothetical protein
LPDAPRFFGEIDNPLSAEELKMQRLMSRLFLGISVAASISLTLPGCGGGATQTGTAPEAHSATIGGDHGAVGGAAGPDAPAGAQ